MKIFFISYTSADRAWAEWIAWQLEEAGYSTVIQAWDFRPGSNFVQDMQTATAEAKRTIAVFSPDYLKSCFCQPEWQAAFAQDPTGEKGILLPIRVRECDLEGLLPQIVYIDLVDQNETKAKKDLLAGVHRGRAKPESKPDFPGKPDRSVLKQPRFPGTLPSIQNIPHLRNRNFAGREDLLTNLREQLTSTRSVALTAFTGLGGVGKTQLALEYAYRNATGYSLVWWIRSEELATLAADYAALAGQLDLPEREEADQSIQVEAIREWLRQNPEWLLIFDNAREPEDLQHYLPPGTAGHVIVTSRNPNWGSIAQSLSVQVFERNESVSFLCRRTGQTDEEAAAKLAEALADLPLALEQAGAYIEATGRAFSDYLDLFHKHRKDVLSRGKLAAYPDTVATTWQLSFQEIQQELPAATELLNLCAFLAPDDIPQKVIQEGTAHLPESLAAAVSNPLAFDDALAILRRYSLIEVQSETVSLHRLVQAVVRDQLEEEQKKTYAKAAVRLIKDAFPFEIDVVDTWSESIALLPHALVATGYAQNAQVALEEVSSLLDEAGGYLRQRAEFSDSRTCHERALQIGEQVYGPEHPAVATYVNNLGSVLQDLGELEEARTCFERALRIFREKLGENHPSTLKARKNLNSLLQQLATHHSGEMKTGKTDSLPVQAQDPKRQKAFRTALEEVNKRYGPALKKLAE